MVNVIRIAAAITFASGGAIPTDASVACQKGLPGQVSGPARPIAADDLVRLRDLGFPDGSLVGYPSPLAVSPDGSEVAFILNQGDPDSNTYCRTLVTIGLEKGARARIADRGGELITVTDLHRNLYIPGGFPNVVQPAWSRDGRWIAYLRRDAGVTQAWRARADGSGAEQLTRSAVDIEALAWNADGTRLILASRPGIGTIQSGIDAESRGGFLYDERFMPSSSARPMITAPVPRVLVSIDPSSMAVRPADDEETKRIGPDLRPGERPPLSAQNERYRAWTEREGRSPLSPMRVRVATRDGRSMPCVAVECAGSILGMWWLPGSDSVNFLRREGWANGQLALYRWRPGSSRPVRVLTTEHVLDGCVPTDALLLCTVESALAPKRIVLVDPASGTQRLVFDPNPEFANFQLGTVERIKWRNHLGIEAWGDLVLPPGYRPGAKLPLIVVQYHSDGFLRGGTGDEYPIHAFAARGFAVLSVERTADAATASAELENYDQINAAGHRGWNERRSQLSSLVEGVRLVVERGIAHPKRIGITGLSDGSSTARFALINSRLFAAASISTCCIEPRTVMTYVGTAYADMLRRWGYPDATRDDPDFWRDYSLAMNAKNIDTPLLMQLADDEYLLALETFTALREHAKPVEMHIFSGEFHTKWQPAHRLAVYARNLDWFDFWLRSIEDTDPVKRTQYVRWRAMRARRGNADVSRDNSP